MRLEVPKRANSFSKRFRFYGAQVPGLALRFIAEMAHCQKALLQT
jgi:hypothetical protein